MTLTEKEKIAVLGALNLSLELLANSSQPKITWNEVTHSMQQIRSVRDLVQKVEVETAEQQPS